MNKQRKPVENGEIKVEKGVPPPTSRGKSKWPVYPLKAMDVGDSFFVPCDEAEKYQARQSVRNQAIGQRLHVVIRGEPGGFRVWRVK